jgi:hypothetical protein
MNELRLKCVNALMCFAFAGLDVVGNTCKNVIAKVNRTKPPSQQTMLLSLDTKIKVIF